MWVHQKNVRLINYPWRKRNLQLLLCKAIYWALMHLRKNACTHSMVQMCSFIPGLRCLKKKEKLFFRNFHYEIPSALRNRTIYDGHWQWLDKILAFNEDNFTEVSMRTHSRQRIHWTKTSFVLTQKRDEDWKKLNDNEIFFFRVREIIEISSTNRESDKNMLSQPEWRKNCLFYN